MAGAEGWYYTVSIGASGDDYTGLVAPLARIALTVVAAVTLWRSRRTDDNRPWRYLRRTLIGVLSLIVAVMVVRRSSKPMVTPIWPERSCQRPTSAVPRTRR